MSQVAGAQRLGRERLATGEAPDPADDIGDGGRPGKGELQRLAADVIGVARKQEDTNGDVGGRSNRHEWKLQPNRSAPRHVLGAAPTTLVPACGAGSDPP